MPKVAGAETQKMAKRWYSVSVLSNFEKKVAEAHGRQWPPN